MNLVLAKHVDTLVKRAESESAKGDLSLAWKLLEEAHIFSQPIATSHLFVHWEMFRLARKEGSRWEMLGQFLRLLLAIPSSLLKVYPVGNSGRATVGMFKSEPLSKRIAAKFKEIEKLEAERRKNNGQLKSRQRQHPLSRR